MSVDFLDSNVFVYLFDDRDDRKRALAEGIVTDAIEGGRAIVSAQVVQEVVNVLTRKLGASPNEARRFMDAVLTPLWAIGASPSMFARALGLRERYALAWYDALIVAAALEAGCTRLRSEDLQHGQRIETLTIENPFLA